MSLFNILGDENSRFLTALFIPRYMYGLVMFNIFVKHIKAITVERYLIFLSTDFRFKVDEQRAKLLTLDYFETEPTILLANYQVDSLKDINIL